MMAALLLSDGKLGIKFKPSRTNCDKCNKEIPPGKPGRKCEECRNELQDHSS